MSVLIPIALLLHGCKHPSFPCIFYFNKTFSQGRFRIKSYFKQIKSPRKLSLKMVRLYFHRLLFQELFSTGLL